MKTTLSLLEKMYEAAKELDGALMDYVHHGKSDMTGAEYERINDVLIEVEQYLM